jgi:hypothetical protein
MHGYYMLTYEPKNQDYNGRFRQISVKLARSNLEVQTRKGYYVESVGCASVLDYEAPAIAAARTANGNSLSLKGAALSFPASHRTGLSLIPQRFHFLPSPCAKQRKKSYTTDFSLVALVRINQTR